MALPLAVHRERAVTGDVLGQLRPGEALLEEAAQRGAALLLGGERLGVGRDAPDQIKELEKSRKLPIRAVAAGSGVSKKVLDRYRRYVIMAILILNGDYPQLSEYLKFVLKDGTA